jgi:predicted amidophosphoribosyltransferase
MKKAVCPNCGADLDERGYHLCRNASFPEPRKCEYCGKTITDPRHVCRAMLSHLRFTCAECGRIAVDDQFLCNPISIK